MNPGHSTRPSSGDVGSAAIIAQVFDSVTGLDPSLTVRPALARSWNIEDGGRRIVFHLREGVTFSDGTPLRAGDVVRSWLRLIDPAAPSPLASLLDDVVGAVDYRRGVGSAESVGLRAAGNDVEVDLVRPAADFVSIVAGPTFGVVPPDFDRAARPSTSFVSSGAYRPVELSDTELTLEANEAHWAGRPALARVRIVTTLAGRSPVEAFDAGELDFTPISDFDASWIAYDRDLGPRLREVPALAVSFYGFDAGEPPFDDVRVRQAFAAAVDWKRIVELGSDSSIPATSMVPPGIPGRSEKDFGPVHDLDAARDLLADAGYPEGRGFPSVAMMTSGGQFDEAIVSELENGLGVEIDYETMDFDPYFERLTQDPPDIWSIDWIADYPGANDFLGLLLGTDQPNNYGRWRSAQFDEAIASAIAATDPTVARTAFDEAERIVQQEAPVVPVSYAAGWALAADGLLGAGQNGLGIPRFAGLAWETP